MMNKEYLERMREMLGDEYDAYAATLDQAAERGFRINTLKCSKEQFFHIVDIEHRTSPYAENGYYTNAKAGIGYSPAYMAGLFYMQEASASAAVTVLDVKKGMNVVDLCAAPGSKSTQILEKLNGTGMLAANEIDHKRSQILASNIEHHGASNALVLNADTKDVADAFEEFFDAVLCDAPCSGEGMFRKSNDAVNDWSISNVLKCAERQKEILTNAYRCLKKGGVMVYSTCTFSKEENEENISWFLKKYPDMVIERPNVSFGRRAFELEGHTSDAVRIFPMDGGEGHFICRMRRQGDSSSKVHREIKSQKIPASVQEAVNQILIEPYPYMLLYHGRIYGGTAPFYDCGKCHIVKDQVLLGTIEKNDRFEPDHQMAVSVFSQFRLKAELDDVQLQKYFHGEQLAVSIPKGYCQLTWHGIGVGLGKSDGTYIKNKYPKGLRTR